MGAKDDDYFVRRYEAGKQEVFFAINSRDDSLWVDAFLRVIRERNLRPVFYVGAGRNIVPSAGSSNNFDDEIRGDFYPAKTKVMYFGDPKNGSDNEDHWVLSNLAHVGTQHALLVYVSKSYPVEVLRRYGFKGTAIVVADPAEFEKSLREILFES
jgi:hypothetical protein